MEWLKRLKKDKETWEGFLVWLNKLDAETVQKYDAAKDFNEWLLAKGGRLKVQEIKLRLLREETPS